MTDPATTNVSTATGYCPVCQHWHSPQWCMFCPVGSPCRPQYSWVTDWTTSTCPSCHELKGRLHELRGAYDQLLNRLVGGQAPAPICKEEKS